MHVLLIHQAFASIQEAGGTRHFELLRHLVAKGHQATVIASQTSYLTGTLCRTADTRKFVHKEIVDGIEIQRVRAYSRIHRSFASRVFSFVSFMLLALAAGLRVRKVDLVIGTSPPIFQGVSAMAVAWLKRIPCVFEVRDLWPDFAVEMRVLRSRLVIAAARRLEEALYRHARLVIVNSPAYVRHVERKGVPGARIALVPNGVDINMFNPAADGASIRAELGLEDQFVALYAGAHGQANDLATLLKAAHQLQVQMASHIVLVLIGDGKEKQRLIALSRELGLRNVRFVPAQPKGMMPAYLSAANACIAILQDLPMFAMTYPNKVFDYMAAGRPTILAIDGVIREVIEKARAGIFVPPGDFRAMTQALCQLAGDPGRCIEMGLSGRRYVEDNFDRADQARKFELALRSIADRPLPE